jgi:hypothetical protein
MGRRDGGAKVQCDGPGSGVRFTSVGRPTGRTIGPGVSDQDHRTFGPDLRTFGPDLRTFAPSPHRTA